MRLELNSRDIERLRHPIRTLRNGLLRLAQATRVDNIPRSLRGRLNARDLRSRYQAALSWIEDNTVVESGIRVTNRRARPYPEVTGYYIPTLLDWGERDRAFQFARWLLKIQNADGSWSDPEGKVTYTFDTGQILKGLIAILPDLPEAEQPLRRGCDWLLTRIEPSGRMTTPDTSGWSLARGRTVPESIHLYTLQPLRDAAVLFNESSYTEAAERTVRYYLDQPSLVEFTTLSHFHAYILEALVDLGYSEVAAKGMAEVERLQRASGAVPGYADVNWVCSTGLAQYAVIWYKLGQRERAAKAFEYLCKLQNRSGGFFGSYGWGADYSPDEEISWAVKYFLDAYYWHVRTAFDEEADRFPATIPTSDGRYRAIAKHLGNVSNKRILDAGCGKGRFGRELIEQYPAVELWAVDVSDEMLRFVPPQIKTRQASLLRLPFQDGYFDGVFCIEALEHALNPEAAIRELCRVVKPDGAVVIIDKNRERRGMLGMQSWESWFDEEEVTSWLKRYCDSVGSEFISYDNLEEPDRLFIAWHGVRS